MKKLLLISFALLLISRFVIAQNLVPNPGFETFNGCPTADGQIIKATGWTDPTGTAPDYFNACASSGSGYSVPANDLGSMNARTGNAYAGFFTYFSLSFYTTIREYMQIQLSSPLVANKVYNVSFYVARAAACDHAASTIGAFFTNSPVHPPQSVTGLITPQVANPSSNVITDTASWTLISGSFTAAGGEEYVTIGNFNTSPNSGAVFMGGASSTYSAYYLIDDISVVEDNTTGIVNPDKSNRGSKSNTISLSPNPVSDELLVRGDLNAERSELIIFNMIGEIIYRETISSKPQVVSCKTFPAGIYYVKIMNGSGQWIEKFVKD